MANGDSSWISWLGNKAGDGLVSGAFSAPVSFFVTFGLQEAFPGLSPGAKILESLARIEKAVGRIEEKLDRGLEQINKNFEELGKHLDIQHLENLIAILEQYSADPIEDIQLYFTKLQQQKDLPKIADKRLDIEGHINKLTDVLRGGSNSPFPKGLLKLWNEMFVKEFTQNGKSDSSHLISSYLLLENRFDHFLHWLLQGVILVEYGYCKNKQLKDMQEFHDAFVKDKLKPLLDEYLWWTEDLVIKYIMNFPYGLDEPSYEESQRLIGVLLYIFKRCDFLVFGVLSSFLHEEPPHNLLCGRVIGPKWVLECGEKRVSELMKLTKPMTEKGIQLFAPMETVSPEHSVSLIDFKALIINERLFLNKISIPLPQLIPPENSRIQVLRYRLTGFPEEIVDSQDNGEKPEGGSPESKMRGIPGIEQIGYPSIWDKRFNQITDDIPCDESLSIGGLRYRAETLLALTIPSPFATLDPELCQPVDTNTPYIYSTKYTKNLHSWQLIKSQNFWNWSPSLTSTSVDDRSSFDTERKLPFCVTSSGSIYRGHVHKVWRTLLFGCDKTMKPIKINIGLRIAWQVVFYGADIDYVFKIDLVKTKGLGLFKPEEFKELIEFLPLRQGKHLPESAWTTYSKQETFFNRIPSLQILPGECVWLRAEGAIYWPYREEPIDKMEGCLQFNAQDIMFSWVLED